MGENAGSAGCRVRVLDKPCGGQLRRGTSVSGGQMEIRVGRGTILARPNLVVIEQLASAWSLRSETTHREYEPFSS